MIGRKMTDSGQGVVAALVAAHHCAVADRQVVAVAEIMHVTNEFFLIVEAVIGCDQVFVVHGFDMKILFVVVLIGEICHIFDF